MTEETKPTDADGEEPPASSRSTEAKRSGSGGIRRNTLPTPRDAFATVEASWGYPAFAREFPRDPELDALVAAFARGDYRAIRERAPKLASSTTDERVRQAATTLRERIEPDPTSRILFVLAAALLAILTGWWVSHSGTDEAKDGGRQVTPGK